MPPEKILSFKRERWFLHLVLPQTLNLKGIQLEIIFK
jgi:hypothetical protein